MQASQLLTADVLDIIFDGKNKAYGAYNLRKTYNNRLLKSMLILISLLVLLIGSYFIAAGRKGNIVSQTEVTPPIILTEVPTGPEPVVPPPPPAPKSLEQVRTQTFTTIQIVNTEIPEEQIVPDQASLEKAQIGTITTDGVDAGDIVAPPASSGRDGKGIVDGPRETGNENGGFVPIEIESQYPGGVKAWRRFLERNLGSNYPPDAFDKNISGTVVIQFIVDRDGTVSNVEAISGPDELRGAAVTVIKKSGKWDPAVQNGNKVKSYKKQPITFQIENN